METLNIFLLCISFRLSTHRDKAKKKKKRRDSAFSLHVSSPRINQHQLPRLSILLYPDIVQQGYCEKHYRFVPGAQRWLGHVSTFAGRMRDENFAAAGIPPRRLNRSEDRMTRSRILV